MFNLFRGRKKERKRNTIILDIYSLFGAFVTTEEDAVKLADIINNMLKHSFDVELDFTDVEIFLSVSLNKLFKELCDNGSKDNITKLKTVFNNNANRELYYLHLHHFMKGVQNG